MRRALTVLVLSAGLLAAGGCGDSAEEKAQNEVCDARAGIEEQVSNLQSLTLSTASVSAVTSSVDSIKSDLGKIKDAQDELSDERQQELKSANEAFTSQINSIVQNVISSKSLSEAGAQLESAVTQLAGSYQQTFARYSCS